jgi:hypothetical protein
MISATAHPVDDLAHRDAPDAHTLHEAALVAEEETATSTVAATVAPGPPTVVRKVREVISRLTVQVVELRRVQ